MISRWLTGRWGGDQSFSFGSTSFHKLGRSVSPALFCTQRATTSKSTRAPGRRLDELVPSHPVSGNAQECIIDASSFLDLDPQDSSGRRNPVSRRRLPSKIGGNARSPAASQARPVRMGKSHGRQGREACTLPGRSYVRQASLAPLVPTQCESGSPRCRRSAFRMPRYAVHVKAMNLCDGRETHTPYATNRRPNSSKSSPFRRWLLLNQIRLAHSLPVDFD